MDVSTVCKGRGSLLYIFCDIFCKRPLSACEMDIKFKTIYASLKLGSNESNAVAQLKRVNA